MADSSIRYVNRSSIVVRLPTPRGSRMALAPGEYTTHPYYQRFSRAATEKVGDGKRPLTREYEDGSPVGCDAPPVSVAGVQAPPSVRVATRSIPPQPGGCSMGCEAACQFPAESSPDTVARINATMNQGVTPAESMLTAQHALEPGIAPPMPVAQTAPQQPQPTMPPPIVNDAHRPTTQASVEQVMEHFALTDQDVLEVHEGYLKVTIASVEQFVCRYELGWKADKLIDMKNHLKKYRN